MYLKQTVISPLIFSLAAVSNSAPDKKMELVVERVATQNPLFDEQYESDLREFPERATDFGDYRYNDKLADRSLAAIMRREELDESFLRRLHAISTAGFSEQDQLSHDILMRGLEQRIADFQLKEYEMPINQFSGIHTKGWTRDQVLEFMRKASVADEPSIQSETDRYIAWPAQALSYKIGQLKFLELRERARKELGSKFDIRTFHDEMLGGGSMSLDLLETRTDSWIAQQRSND